MAFIEKFITFYCLCRRMSFSRGVARFTGSLTLSLGILFIVASLFLLSFSDNLENNLDSIIDESFASYLEDNQDEIIESLAEENPEFQDVLDACDSGELTVEECELSADNPIIAELFEEQKDSLKEQIRDAFAVVPVLAGYASIAITVGAMLLVAGLILLAFGVSRDWLLFGQKIGSKVGFSFALSFAAVWYFVNLSEEGLRAQIEPLAEGAPDLLVDFLVTLVQNLLTPVFEPFYYPFLVLAVLGLALWLGLFFARKMKKKGKA